MAKINADSTFRSDYTVEDIEGLYQEAITEDREARLRTLSETFRTLVKLDHEVEIPTQYRKVTKVVKTPFVRDTWHRVTGAIVARNPVVHIDPLDEKQKQYRDAAAVGERFDTAMRERLAREIGEDIDWQLTGAVIRDGESVLKVLHRGDAWARFPPRGNESADEYGEKSDDFVKRADLPIAWRPLDRLTCLFEEGEYGDLWAMEVGEYPRPYLAGRYGMKRGEDGKLVTSIGGRPRPSTWGARGTNRSVKVEFFTDKEWHVIIDGMEAPDFPKENPYAPHLPYFRAKAPESESLLYSLMFLVPALDSLLTMKMNWSYLTAFPIPILETVPNSLVGVPDVMPLGEDGRPTPMELTPGKLLELPLGKRLIYLTPSPTGKDIDDLIGILKNLIDIAGIPSVARGIGGADQAGYAINQLIQAAQVANRVAVQSLSRQASKALEFTHWLIEEVVRQRVYVMGWSSLNGKTGRPTRKSDREWLSLSRDGPVGVNTAPVSLLGTVTLAFRPTLPTDEQARAMIANQLTNSPKPLSSQRHAMEYWLEEEDPDSILDEIWVEQAQAQDPVLHQKVVAAAERDAGLLPEAGAVTPGSGGPGMGGGGMSSLVGPNGQPMFLPGPSALTPGESPIAPGQAAGGMPSVGGINRPMMPESAGMRAGVGGRSAGAYPGRPGGPNR